MDRFNHSQEFEFTNLTKAETPRPVPPPPKDTQSPQQERRTIRNTGCAFTWSQIRAIIYKNIAFQRRQVATNIFQMLSPLICVVLIWLAQYEMRTWFREDYSFNKIHGIPFFLNLPTSFMSQSAAYPISSSDCLKWFLYEDARNASAASLSLDDLIQPQFSEYCRRVDKSVPVFNKTSTNVNQEIYESLEYLDRYPISLGQEIEELDRIPDGAVVFNDYRKDGLDMVVQVNDLLFNEFHRDNGFSKLSFKMPGKGFNFFKELRDDYLPSSLNTKSVDNGLQRLSEYFNGNLTIDTKQVVSNSKAIYNKTQSALKKILSNKNTTFPVD